METVGSCLVILGLMCAAGGFLLQYADDTATIGWWDKLQYGGLGAGAVGLLVLGLGMLVG